MSNYVKSVDFAIKDTYLSGDSRKKIVGADIDTEFINIATAVNSKANAASAALTGTPTAPTAVAGTNTTQVATTAFVTGAITDSASSTETLTNKTLTAPILTDPVLGTPASGDLTNCTGLPVAGGGTGAATLEANAVLTGNGTSAVGSVAPGTSGNVLTSNGTVWVSTAPVIVSMTTVQTRTQAEYSAPISGNGTEIALLTMTFTPKKAGNKVILEWHVSGEMNSLNAVYTVTRNDVILADATDGTNIWSGVIAEPHDTDWDSTPNTRVIRIIDSSTLDVSSTYKVHVRSSASALTLRLNRSWSSTGAYNYETTLSTATATEINV